MSCKVDKLPVVSSVPAHTQEQRLDCTHSVMNWRNLTKWVLDILGNTLCTFNVYWDLLPMLGSLLRRRRGANIGGRSVSEALPRKTPARMGTGKEAEDVDRLQRLSLLDNPAFFKWVQLVAQKWHRKFRYQRKRIHFDKVYLEDIRKKLR